MQIALAPADSAETPDPYVIPCRPENDPPGRMIVHSDIVSVSLIGQRRAESTAGDTKAL